MSTTHLEIPTSRGTADRSLVAGALALGALIVAALLVVRPWGERDEFGYDDVAPIRDDAWAGIVADGLALAIVAVTLSIAVCSLAPRRGRVWATVGAALTTIGGIVFASGAAALATVLWYATDEATVPADVGTDLVKLIADGDASHATVLQMAGFLAYTVGTLALSVALLRAGTVTKWLPIAFIVTTITQFAPVPARVLDFVQVGAMALLVVLAVLFARKQHG
jgi:hypothetical protein